MVDASSSATWVTSLIQVGIPSVVAVVSLVLTFLVTKAGHKKDLKIAEISLAGKLGEAASVRGANLVREIAEAISAVEIAIGKHSGVFRKYSHSETFPDGPDTEASLMSAYADLCVAIDACCGARAKVNLLGNPEISVSFELFLEKLFGFQHEANPAIKTNRVELSLVHDEVVERVGILMQMLSTIYLQGK